MLSRLNVFGKDNNFNFGWLTGDGLYYGRVSSLLLFNLWNITHMHLIRTLSEAWSGVNWADLKAAQGAFGTDFYDRSTKTIVGMML